MSPSRKSDIDTPALLLGLNAFERNIQKMARFFEGTEAKLRPHFKCHRTIEVAKRQLEAGAIGITCAKLAEAELLMQEGIEDVLIANEVAGRQKIERLTALSRRSKVIVAIDDGEILGQMSRAALDAGAEIQVLVDVDVGMQRCGVQSMEEAVELARLAESLKGINFRGLMGYEGHLQSLPRDAEKTRRCEQSVSKLIETSNAVESAGIKVEIVSAGGTGTYHITGKYPGITEVQAGSYAFMDTYYTKAGANFEYAATILATVLSCPTKGHAVADAGMKSIHPVLGMPEVRHPSGVSVKKLNAEHTILAVEGRPLRVGERIELYVPYVDGTFNLHPRIYCVRGEDVEDVWEIKGRYCSA